MNLRNILTWTTVVVVIGVFFAMVTWVTPSYRVSSGSMEPMLPVGSTVFTYDASCYKQGDVITFRSDDQSIVTHRIIEITASGEFVTQGDANPSPDNWQYPITQDAVVGKVIAYTPFTGFAGWFTLRGMILLFSIVAVIALVLWRVEESSEDEAPANVS